MTFIDMHPENPQARFVARAVQILREGGIIAMPTDSGYAIATKLGNKDGMDVIREIRKLDEKHNFSLLCSNFSQIGELVTMGNSEFRTLKALTPGPYTFIMRGTKEVPRMTLNKKKHTIGVRLPEHTITRAIVEETGEPIVCSTLIMPGEDQPLTDGYEVDDRIGHSVDLVIVGPCGEAQATTVVDFTDGAPVVVRKGAGDTSLFD